MSSISARPGFNSNNAVEKFINSQETSMKKNNQDGKGGNGSKESSLCQNKEE